MNIDPNKRAQNFQSPEQKQEAAHSSSTHRKTAGPSAEGGVATGGLSGPKSAVSLAAEQLAADQAAHYASMCGSAKQACARLLERPAHAAGQVATELAKKLDGKGGGLSSLVQEFQGEAYRNMSAAQAWNKFAERAIKQSPVLAEPLIELKLKGVSDNQRALVQLYMQQSGSSGWFKYAACVNALNMLGKYTPEQLGDLAALTKTRGTTLQQAMKIEDAELARARALAPSPQPASLDDLNRQAIAGADAQLAACRALNDKVRAANLQVRGINPLARGAVGLVNATGTVGNVVLGLAAREISGNPAVLEGALHSADRAASMLMQSEFNGALASARAGHDQFSAQYLQYCDLNARYKQAIRTGDYKQAASTFNAMTSLVPRMKASAESFGAAAARVGKLHKEFDGAAIHAAIHLAVSAISVGIGGPPGEHLVSSVVGHEAGSFYGAAVESAVTKGAAAALGQHH
ncbi:MAG: hypothetical protein HY898_34600 [Deltaproteobacteria bacterium]|nr:hypothetical protein [Deltaproteobacteria bacterium]